MVIKVISTRTVRFLVFFIVIAFILQATNYVRNSSNRMPIVYDLQEDNINSENFTDVSDDLELCPETPPNLGPITVEKLLQLGEGAVDVLVGLEPGGSSRPIECRARQSVAIIVPAAPKDSQRVLMMAFYVIHSLLVTQQVDYRIFVVQAANKTNLVLSRGLLMNIGFLVAKEKRRHWDCFVFHTASIIPTDTRNLYRCTPDHVVQLMSTVTDFSYIYDNWRIRPRDTKRLFGTTKKVSFGHVIAMTKQQVLDVNGFSNGFWDDDGEFRDLGLRLKHANHHIKRNTPDIISRFVRLDNMEFRVEESPAYYKKEPMAATLKPDPELQDGISTVPFHTQTQNIHYLYTSIEVDTDVYPETMNLSNSEVKTGGQLIKLS